MAQERVQLIYGSTVSGNVWHNHNKESCERADRLNLGMLLQMLLGFGLSRAEIMERYRRQPPGKGG